MTVSDSGSVRCTVTDGVVSFVLPDRSIVRIPPELVTRSRTLEDAAGSVNAEQGGFTLRAPAEWLQLWSEVVSCRPAESPNLEGRRTEDILKALKVRHGLRWMRTSAVRALCLPRAAAVWCCHR